jgi:hypothetical protein
MEVYLVVNGLVLDDHQAIRDYIQDSKIFASKENAYGYIFKAIISYTEDREDDEKDDGLGSIRGILERTLTVEEKLLQIKKYMPRNMFYEVFPKILG